MTAITVKKAACSKKNLGSRLAHNVSRQHEIDESASERTPSACSTPNLEQDSGTHRGPYAAGAAFRSNRQRIEALLETLIDLLDQLDGDCDLEDGHDAESDPAEYGLADRDALDEFIWDAQPEQRVERTPEGDLILFGGSTALLSNCRAMEMRPSFPRRRR